MKLTIAFMSIAALRAPSVSASGVAASILKHKNKQGSIRLSASKNKECSFVDGFKVNLQKTSDVEIAPCEIGELCEEDSTSPLGGRCVTVSSKPVALTPRRQLVGESWIKLGQDINGEAAGDRSGRSVSLSADGNVLAIGAPYNDGENGVDSGHVRVYGLVNDSWTQVGQDINGEAADDWSGRSVSLSADGTVLAIGAYGNDGNNSNSGHVRVYGLVNDSWTQIGEDIDGEAADDESGISVSLSADGHVLAIGAYLNDGNGSNNSGHVRVFESFFPFVNIGEGSCLDSSDQNYPYIVGYFDSGTFDRTDPQTCIDWCTQAPQHIEKLVGIEVSGFQQCYCRFDTAVVGGVSASDFSSPDPTGGLLDTHTGTGNIDGHSTNNSERDCYRNEVSPLSAVF